jgi:hypothetical protein
MATNASSLVNFGTTGPAVGEFIYAIGPRSAPSYLPADNAATSYLASSYPALFALMTTPVTAFAATARTLPGSADWNAVAYGNGKFVAVSTGGAFNGRIATSSDGINWVTSAFVGTGWTDVVFGNGIFVALSGGTSVITSPDGVNWTSRTSPVSLYYVGFGGGIFVGVMQGSALGATSPDGITWTSRTLPSSGSWIGVAFGNNTFVAVMGGSLSTTAATSPDGFTWTARTLSSAANWASVAFGNGTFVAVPFGSNAAVTSSDGITWTSRTLSASAAWRKVMFGNGSFVAISGNTAVASTSTNGTTWTAQTLPAADYVGGCYGGVPGTQNFVTVAQGPTTAAASIAYSVTQTTFTLPVISPVTGTTAYVKAT